MSRISLRDYFREIEGLIDNNQNEDAVANCRHILQDFPKNVAAHRLLGKALLELQEYEEAAAAFQQVLEAVPDDFVAHLGMSVIREHEGDMNPSIRHMERAFDVQPANAIIQGELRRLYKQRDGLEPQKIHLTRGALARMYAKGDLYSQAIAELRAALGEDPQRPDLQIVLAKMYAKAGQLLEAAETCNSLLNKLPDCLEAHTLLGDILSRAERSAEGMTHYQRAAALDPYAAQLSPGQPDLEGFPDDAVMLDKLEYSSAEPVEVPVDQAWVEPPESRPITEEHPIEQAEEVELEQETNAPGEQPVEPEKAGETPAQQIPDWMQSAGWEPASGAVKEPEPELEGEPEEQAEEEEGLVKAEIPDWLKPLAPPEAEEAAFPEPESGEPVEAATPGSGEIFTESLQSAAPPSETGPEEEVPDWLKAAEETRSEAEEELPGWLEGEGEKEPELEGEMPDWLKTSEETGDEAEGELPGWMEAEGEVEPELEAESPDWLKGAEEGPGEPQEELPDWLKSAEEEQAEPSEAVPGWMEAIEADTPVEGVFSGEGARIYSAVTEGEPELAGGEPEEPEEQIEWSPEAAAPEPGAVAGLPGEQEAGFPEWMNAMDEGLEAEQSYPAGEPEMEGSGEIEGTAGEAEVPDWLRSLGEETLAEEEETAEGGVEMPFLPDMGQPDQAEAPSGASEVPDWLRAALEEQEQSVAGQPEDIPDWLRSSIPEGFPEEPPPIEGDTKPVRPREVEEEPAEGPAEETFVEQAPAEPAEPKEEIALEEPEERPEDIPAEIPAEVTAEAGVFAFEEEEVQQTEESREPGTGAEEEAEAMAWLESLAAREGASEEELLTRPEDRSAAIPEWLQKMAADTESGEEVAEEQALEGGEEMEGEQPAWTPEYETEVQAESGQAFTAQSEISGEQAPAGKEMEQAAPSWQAETEAGPVEAGEAALEAETEQVLAGEEREIEPAGWGPDMKAEAEMPSEPVETMEPEPAEAPKPEAELPEWLRDFDEVETAPVEVEEVADSEAVTPHAEPLDLNRATLSQLERIPGIGYIQAQSIVSYREEHGPLYRRADLENVPEISPEVIDRLEEAGAFEHPAEGTPQVEEFAEVALEVESGSQPTALAEAWSKLVAGELSDAVGLYGELIRKEQHLDQVIHELREAAFLYPQEISLHQALGDAYLRANRLQEALDAYNKAEGLLK